MEYYQKAFALIGERIDNPFYIVFSDDLDWVKGHIKFDKDVFFVNEEKRLEDYEELLIMSKCKHNIIANSTFSWWGAWLNENENRIVIGPSNWFNTKGRNTGYNIMPSNWIKI